MRVKRNTKITKNVLALALIASVLCSSVASAETQSGKSHKYGKDIKYSLDCDFSLMNEDKATAITQWDGKDKYTVKTVLFYSLSMQGEYRKISTSTHKTKAKATGATTGVWTFLSKHYVCDNAHDTTVKLCEYTDW